MLGYYQRLKKALSKNFSIKLYVPSTPRRRMGLAFAQSLIFHAGLSYLLLHTILPPPPQPPANVIQVEYIKRKPSSKDNGEGLAKIVKQEEAKQAETEKVESKKPRYRKRKPKGIVGKTEEPAPPEKTINEKIALLEEKEPAKQYDEGTPAETVVRKKKKLKLKLDEYAELQEIMARARNSASQPHPAPQPQIVEANSDGTYIRYEDGSVLLRNPKIAKPVKGVALNDEVKVDSNGRAIGLPEKIWVGWNNEKPAPYEFDLNWWMENSAYYPDTCDVYKYEPGIGIPDALYIVIDSSSSIGVEYYSHTKGCGYTAAVSALAKKSKVAVINFSSTNYVVKETKNLEEIAKGLARAERMKTMLPGEEAKDIVASNGRKDIVVITDSAIQNYKKAIPYFKEILERNPKNRGYLIVIGDPEVASPPVIKDFIKAGFKVVRYHTTG